jgi:alanine dehydrogenase
MKIAIFKTSNKENEKRVPLYPEHIPFLSEKAKSYLYLERGYGEDFGYTDKYLETHCNSFLNRDELFSECDILILPKPTPSDLLKMRKKQILWGWAHCVQQHEITQIAIDRKITIIAWESMYNWHNNERAMHIFYKNNEIAGYAAVIHALELLGLDGHYGPRRKVTIISYGSVSRGAIYALHGRGFNNLHVYTRRPTHLVADQNPDVYYYNLFLKDGIYFCAPPIGKAHKFIDEISDSDIIINGILQNPISPAMFVKNENLYSLKRNTLIIDISCDEGMGFEFASSTTFKEPIRILPNNIYYYSVDHTPSYLWNAASREISKALIPFLLTLIDNKFDFHLDPSILNAIEIENGFVKNKNILAFQRRSDSYPHIYL